MTVLPKTTKGMIPTADGSAQIPYVTIGEGPVSILVIPGAGDGLRLVTDAAWNLALFYRKRTTRYRTLVASRRTPIAPDVHIEQYADDTIHLLETLGWGPTIIETNSAGGPVGQQMAVKRPDLARGLILSVTLHRANDHLREVLNHWIRLIDEKRWAEFTWSSIERTFRPQTVAQYRLLKPLIPLFAPPPRDPDRARHMLEELLTLDQSALLRRIQAPTLVIGGEDDQVIDASIQREMASLIPNSEIILYPGYGHGNDQENPDYQRQVDRFVTIVEERSG